jgi:hypothetical protein
VIILWVGVAVADPGADIARQRALTDRAAEASAQARADGLRRTEVAERYAEFRTAKLELDRLLALVPPPPHQDVVARRAAVDALRVALAEGQRTSGARSVVADWLGEPAERLGVWQGALAGSVGAPAAIRRAMLLDILEQADALAVLLAFDAAVSRAVVSEAGLRAATLRRRAPGQSPSMVDELEAVRALDLARRAAADEERSRGLLVRVASFRAAALAALGEGAP